jgi:hypothetical protein
LQNVTCHTLGFRFPISGRQPRVALQSGTMREGVDVLGSGGYVTRVVLLWGAEGGVGGHGGMKRWSLVTGYEPNPFLGARSRAYFILP